MRGLGFCRIRGLSGSDPLNQVQRLRGVYGRAGDELRDRHR